MKTMIADIIGYTQDIAIYLVGIVVSLVVLSFFVNILPFLVFIGMVAVVGGAYCTYDNIATARYIKAQNSR